LGSVAATLRHDHIRVGQDTHGGEQLADLFGVLRMLLDKGFDVERRIL